ncbi:MAG: DUF3789 domain-containing protein [Oscillospiraceae bacterium]|nr:DUF3789 domain-containing protein [Oscillospiraceae bacterium]
MLGFILGCMVGGTAGVMTMCMCAISRRTK